jgi:phosphonoacetaldehyde hydrolase
MTVVTSEAARQGFSPDAVVCADEVPAGRPAPWMCFENARRLDIYPMAAMVKVDDTPVGIESGLNAGMWTVGVIESGNEIGLSLDQIESLFPTQRTERCHRAEDRMNKTNAHFIINSVAELPAVLDAIEVRLTSGERP